MASACACVTGVSILLRIELYRPLSSSRLFYATAFVCHFRIELYQGSALSAAIFAGMVLHCAKPIGSPERSSVFCPQPLKPQSCITRFPLLSLVKSTFLLPNIIFVLSTFISHTGFHNAVILFCSVWSKQ